MGGMLLQKFSRLSFMFYLKNHYTGLFFCCEPMGNPSWVRVPSDPWVELCLPVRNPVPTCRVRVFVGYGYRYGQNYPWVTHAVH